MHWTLVLISLILGVALLFAFSYLGTIAFAHTSTAAELVRSRPIPADSPSPGGVRGTFESGRLGSV